MPALLELEHDLRRGPQRSDVLGRAARAELHFAGRPTPIYRADRLAAELGTAARVYLKREDLAQTGAHKINNVLGQGLLAAPAGQAAPDRRDGRRPARRRDGHSCGPARAAVRRVHGRARHRAPEAERAAHGNAGRRGSPCRVGLGDAQGRDQRGDARLGDERRDDLLRARLGDGAASLSDDRARHAARHRRRGGGADQSTEGRLPDLVVACVGGGSNAIGMFSRFIGEPGVRLVGGRGGRRRHRDRPTTPRRSPAGSLGIIHGARTMLLQDADGQVLEAHSISAGLDYPGVGPQLAALALEGRLELRSAHRRGGARRDAPAGRLRRNPARARVGARARGAATVCSTDVARGRRSCSSGCPAAATRTSAIWRRRDDRARLRARGASARVRCGQARGSHRVRCLMSLRVIPDIATSEAAALAAIDAGADLLEIGLPYSDPLADGVTLQRASVVALATGRPSTPRSILSSESRSATSGTPGCSSWATSTSSWGRAARTRCRTTGRGRRQRRDRGRPARPTRASRSRRHSRATVWRSCTSSRRPPPHDRVEMIAERAGGFVYCVSLTGVTGARASGSSQR